jgi:hypothetical protein
MLMPTTISNISTIRKWWSVWLGFGIIAFVCILIRFNFWLEADLSRLEWAVSYRLANLFSITHPLLMIGFIITTLALFDRGVTHSSHEITNFLRVLAAFSLGFLSLAFVLLWALMPKFLHEDTVHGEGRNYILISSPSTRSSEATSLFILECDDEWLGDCARVFAEAHFFDYFTTKKYPNFRLVINNEMTIFANEEIIFTEPLPLAN